MNAAAAALEDDGARGQESCMTVFGQGSDAQAPLVGAQRGLRPLRLVCKQATELLKACAHMGVKVLNSVSMEAGWNSSD